MYVYEMRIEAVEQIFSPILHNYPQNDLLASKVRARGNKI